MEDPKGAPSDGRSPLKDMRDRSLRCLRVSVTDRCNLRCQYCMPREDYAWLPGPDILTIDETGRLVDAFATLGVQRVRLTGGEPLLRRDILDLVARLSQNTRIKDLAMTTNGLLLADMARHLRDAGLHRLTVSLDTLRPERFSALTKRDGHERVMDGIEEARRTGFAGLKIDTVVTRGINDDELANLVEYGKSVGAEVRFIEYMDVGGATLWSQEKLVGKAQMLDILGQRYGSVVPVDEEDSAPSQRFALSDGTIIGIVASMTSPFCATCDRSRLTADGLWYLCLYAQHGTDLRALVRGGGSEAEIAGAISGRWGQRTDRGAQERKDSGSQGCLVGALSLKQDPHLEMHTRGG